MLNNEMIAAIWAVETTRFQDFLERHSQACGGYENVLDHFKKLFVPAIENWLKDKINEENSNDTH